MSENIPSKPSKGRGRAAVMGIIGALALLIAVVICALCFYDRRTDAVSVALHVPAMRDWNTPARQGGFELTSIERFSSSSNPYLLQTPFGSPSSGGVCSFGDTLIHGNVLFVPAPSKTKKPFWANDFHASGISSTGARSRFGVWTDGADTRSGTNRVATFTIHIPGHYPNSYKFIDVTIWCDDGHKAVWRIRNLPRTHRTVLPTEPVNIVAALPNGEKIGATPTKFYSEINVSFRQLAKPTASQEGEEWEFTPASGYAQFDWDTDDLDRLSKEFSPTFSNAGETSNFKAGSPQIVYTTPDVNSFPETRRIRVWGELSRTAYLDEDVTFRDVPVDASSGDCDSSSSKYERLYKLNPAAPMTATTPSGVLVRLMPDSYGTPISPGGDATLHVEPGMGWCHDFQGAPLVSVPGSPLYKKYRKQVQIIVMMDGDGSGEAAYKGIQDVTAVYPDVPCTLPTMKSVTFTVRQRCVIQRLPISFTIDPSKLPTVNPFITTPKASGSGK